MLAIGLMSGTSLDGVDCVLCEIEGVDESTQLKQLDFLTMPFEKDLKEKLLNLLSTHQTSTRFISSLNFELGHFFAKATLKLIKKNHCDPKDIAYIASHGQTIYHLPHPELGEFASTLQLGEAAVIAYETQIKVISDFRVMDMAAGGQGAPLVPFSEKILFGQNHEKTGLLNLGGIGNITLLIDDNVIAFDTGPANMMIDEAMRILYEKEYDKDGLMASRGKIHDDLLSELKNHPYLNLSFPKSTGREDFGAFYVRNLFSKFFYVKSEDVIRTFTYFSSYCVAKSLLDLNVSLDRLIVSGGGAHNPVIFQDLKDLCPTKSVLTQEDLGFSSDAKEAIAFVILGNQTLHQRPSNVPSATGALKNVVLGKITTIPY